MRFAYHHYLYPLLGLAKWITIKEGIKKMIRCTETYSDRQNGTAKMKEIEEIVLGSQKFFTAAGVILILLWLMDITLGTNLIGDFGSLGLTFVLYVVLEYVSEFLRKRKRNAEQDDVEFQVDLEQKIIALPEKKYPINTIGEFKDSFVFFYEKGHRFCAKNKLTRKGFDDLRETTLAG